MTSRGTCVVIEDDADIRDLISIILTGAGFEVHAEETGSGGLAAVSRLQPVLVTLDLGLPDMDGRDVARHLRAVSTAPILMITAFAEREDELHGIAAGATAYLTKPFRPSQLRSMVQDLCPQRLSS